MRHLLLPLLLCCAGTALAEEGALSCQPVTQIACKPGEACTHGLAPQINVMLWPDSTPVDLCRASWCPPQGPSISICDLDICGSGAIEYGREAHPLGELRKGMAYIAPEPPPRLYAAMFFALAFEAESGTLVLSRFDPEGLKTTWFACVPAAEN